MSERFTFTHQIFLKSAKTQPYRSLRWWKTVKGAMAAAEKHAIGMEVYYETGAVLQHRLVVLGSEGQYITSMAA